MFRCPPLALRLALAFAITTIAPSSAWSADLPRDVPGSADPSVLKRFTGSTLIGYKVDDWDSVRIPVSAATEKRDFTETVAIEGKRTRAVYLSPEGKAPLEVFRNYEQALKASGFKKKFSCEADCSKAYVALGDRGLQAEKGLVWSKGQIPKQDGRGAYSPSSALTDEDGRMLVGTLPRAGGESWIMVYVSKAVGDSTNFSQAFVQVVEPKAMQTGQVTVLNASDIQAGLREDGKVAFYGLYFDSGKADIKPASQPQLLEIGKLLKVQPSLQFFVVGHTDGEGQMESNLQLSQQRAQAVVDALVKSQGVEARRLTAKGVASLAPVSTNANEEGRARNRRVELVVR